MEEIIPAPSLVSHEAAAANGEADSVPTPIPTNVACKLKDPARLLQ